MLPVCPRCAERAKAHEIIGKFPPAPVKCRRCGSPLALVWRPMTLLAVWLGVALLVWAMWQRISSFDLRILVTIAGVMAAAAGSFVGLSLVERDVAADGGGKPLAEDDDGDDGRQAA
ncbi:MAG: hypothetical protein D6740_11530 [Alphaproteobacteria bacterium]|nr:MAG: hypothetical protein D6740_11530 [Alphaproteobacteria bacterium]